MSAILIAALIVLSAAAGGTTAGEPVFPAETWRSTQPVEVDLSGDRLAEMSGLIGGEGCVVRRGTMAFTWGRANKRRDVASCCKPWFTHFLFQAIEHKKLASVDDLVARVEPRLAGLNGALKHKDEKITWRHLANQISCYGVGENPGEAFDYSDFNMALFYDALMLGIYHTAPEKATEEVLGPQLTDILNCEDRPAFDVRGRLSISPRDHARFGLLYLREGNWNGRQLLSKEHVHTILHSALSNDIPRTRNEKTEMLPGQRSLGGGSNQTDHLGSYSYAWWTNGVDRQGLRHWPAAPVDTFAALGNFGKRALVVIPSHDLVLCWNDSKITTREMENEALGKLIQACTPPVKTPR